VVQFITLIIISFVLKLLWDIYQQQKYKRKNNTKHGDVIDLSDAWVDLDNMPYQKREQMLTGRELSLYQILTEILSNNNYNIYPKVRLADILTISSQADNRLQYLSRIKERNVDFLICELPELRPVLIILVEGQMKGKKKRALDRFTKKAVEAAGLPCLKVNLNTLPSVNELSKKMRSSGLNI